MRPLQERKKYSAETQFGGDSKTDVYSVSFKFVPQIEYENTAFSTIIFKDAFVATFATYVINLYASEISIRRSL